MRNLIVRTITGLLFVAAIVVCFLKPLAMVLLFAIVTGLTMWEFTGLVNGRKEVTVNRFISTVAGVYLFLAMAGFCSGLTSSSAFIPYLITLVYLLIAELYARNEDPIDCWAYTMLGQMYVALPLSLINVLAFHSDANGIFYTYDIPLYVFIFLWVSDTGAYCCGSLIGKHKLFPRVSPGKTWEGSIGGAVFVVVAAVLIWYLTERNSIESMGMSVGELIGLGLVVVIFGTWGDLVESLFKRTLCIKDSGNILPGHGGMLDRFDSSLLAIPAGVIYLFTLTLM